MTFIRPIKKDLSTIRFRAPGGGDAGWNLNYRGEVVESERRTIGVGLSRRCAHGILKRRGGGIPDAVSYEDVDGRHVLPVEDAVRFYTRPDHGTFETDADERARRTRERHGIGGHRRRRTGTNWARCDAGVSAELE